MERGGRQEVKEKLRMGIDEGCGVAVAARGAMLQRGGGAGKEWRCGEEKGVGGGAHDRLGRSGV
jgi:hypothetical protein